MLRALIDHPAVFFDGAGSAGRRGAERLDIRQGRLRLRFAGGRDGALTPQLELVGVTLLPPEVAAALRDDRHVVILHGRDQDDAGDGGAPRVLLAEVSPEAAAVVRALALAPVSFPPEAHDALAARLEPLQESVDIELPAQWTRTIGPGRCAPDRAARAAGVGRAGGAPGRAAREAGAGLPAGRGAGAAAGRAGA